ncbi:sunset domain-containing protein [Oenococcus oeni]
MIKGSVDHIYHVPGSTYYNRTKNVVQWFKTVSDAVKAGYRAPLR